MYPILELKKVSKCFGKKEIYRDVSFKFENGCHAIVGPNGVGKTVLIEMISGVVHQTSGAIALTKIGTNTSLEYKQKLIYVPQEASFFPTATGADFLNLILSVKKISPSNTKLDELIEGFKLNAYLNLPFKDMSLGTKRKFFLATLVIGHNSLIVMDEPTNGLDHESINFLSTLIGNLSNQNKILILTTHDQYFLAKINHFLIKLKSLPTCDLIK